MAKRRSVADVLVKRAWWNDMAKLLAPHPTFGTSELHRVRGPLVAQDHRGIWLGEAPSNLVRLKDKARAPAPVLVEIFIPWEHVIALAVLDDPGSVKPGFAVTEVTSDSLTKRTEIPTEGKSNGI